MHHECLQRLSTSPKSHASRGDMRLMEQRSGNRERTLHTSLVLLSEDTSSADPPFTCHGRKCDTDASSQALTVRTHTGPQYRCEAGVHAGSRKPHQQRGVVAERREKEVMGEGRAVWGRLD